MTAERIQTEVDGSPHILMDTYKALFYPGPFLVITLMPVTMEFI